jgi:hypothetical protein
VFLEAHIGGVALPAVTASIPECVESGMLAADLGDGFRTSHRVPGLPRRGRGDESNALLPKGVSGVSAAVLDTDRGAPLIGAPHASPEGKAGLSGSHMKTE